VDLDTVAVDRPVRVPLDVRHPLCPVFGVVGDGDGGPLVAGFRENLDPGVPFEDHVEVVVEGHATEVR